MSTEPTADPADLIDWINTTHRKDHPHSAKGPSVVLQEAIRSVTTACYAIVELGYFDTDSRSEQGAVATWQTSVTVSTHTERIHFFERAASAETLRGLLYASPEADIPDEAIDFVDHYLGYVVLRRDRFRVTCGRSLLRPPTHHPQLGDQRSFAKRVRTLASEDVLLFGIPLTATGVPFIEQDGHVTVCAHASAWMAQYTSVLRGIVPRVPIGEFHEIAASSPATSCPYPSPGLLDNQVFVVLQETGLPPKVRYLADLVDERTAHVLDRAAIRQNGAQVEWLRENATALAARYLNSGLPVLFTSSDGQSAHVRVVCGYVRASALKGAQVIDGDNPVAAFILHDDSAGPYRIESVESVLKEMQETNDPIVVPLPRGVCLPGLAAEQFAATTFERSLDRLGSVAGVEADALKPMLQGLKEAISDCRLAARTYLIESGDFKASFARRCPDEIARGIMATAYLPRYIWVVEVIHRDIRASGDDKSVLSELILDASAISPATCEVLVIHLPGYIASLNRKSGEQYRVYCGIDAYTSGRWRGTDADQWPASGLGRRIKMMGR